MTIDNKQRDEPLRAGVIGVGSMGQHHARIYKTHIGASLIGVADADESRAIEVAERHATRAFDVIDLLEAVDIASVAVPTPYHAKVVRQCIEHGVHVLVEKPYVEDLSVGEELAELAAEQDVTIQVGHIERFNPAFMALDGIVDDLDILAIDAERLGPPLDREVRDNPVIDLMIHDIDLLGTIVDSELVSLDAQGTTGNEYATALFGFDSGVVATLTVSRVTQQKVRRLQITAKSALVCRFWGS
jgi:predicted dehydrogenase